MKVTTAGATIQHCDVLVIGGGPAGSTIAALLAEQGWRVTLLEKERHPRFHIGESLLPMNLPLLQRLGLLKQVEAIGMPKYGAHFVSDRYPERDQIFYFEQALDRSHPVAYQVRRSEFDHLLLRNAAARGTDVRESVRVKDVEFCGSAGVRVHALDAQNGRQIWQARQLVDASGRDTFLANRLGLKRRNPRHGTAAIFGHFNGVERLSGRDAGNISILWFQHGWFWMIPLKDGVMSVGAVCDPSYLRTRGSTSPAEFLWRTIALCPGVQTRMRKAELIDGEARATGNYSYRATRMAGEGWLMVGDAYAFVDPVFSSGVYLAMHSATLGADVVAARLRDPELGARVAREYDRTVRRGLATFSWFIYRFNTPTLHTLFMHPHNVFRMQQAIISVLAGDLFRKTPLTLPLTAFKTIYYTASLGSLADSWRAWRRRRRNARTPFPTAAPPERMSGPKA